jgi:hypothetical protein
MRKAFTPGVRIGVGLRARPQGSLALAALLRLRCTNKT